MFKVEDYIGRKFKVRFNGYNHYLPFKARIISSQDNDEIKYHLLDKEVWNIVCDESEFDKIEVVEIKIKDKGDD